MTSPPVRVGLGEALVVWAKIGLLGFGGPAGQIAIMHRELVERRRWIDEARFLHALNYCMLLPGPEAQQLATYVGWLLHRTLGGVVAGALFVLPGALAVLGLAAAYALGHDSPTYGRWVGGLFFGLKAAVLAIVVDAVIRIGRRALRSRAHRAIAAAAFVGLFAFAVPFPAVVLAAGLIGWSAARRWPAAFVPATHGADAGAPSEPSALDAMAARGELEHTRPRAARAVAVVVVFALLWAGPIAALVAWVGADDVFVAEAVFFSKTAMVTFGGAYAVLAYVGQRAVEDFGWLQAGEMVDGLGLAETTPGPLILVVEFVGFLGAFRDPGGLSPLLAGTIGAAVTLWVTFVPSFLWIFLGAPWVEAIRGHRGLSAAMSAITAAVVGVILNLSLWFGVHVLFAAHRDLDAGPLHVVVPVLATWDPAATVLSALAMLAIFRWKLGVPRTLAACGAAGLAWTAILAAAG